MLMIDLCCGLKGASGAMTERGWTVITLDISPNFEPDILSDVRDWSYQGDRPDLVWASPPCNEFSREFMPWSKTGTPPDMSIYLACRRIIAQANPRFWIIENTVGAVPYFGRPAQVLRSFYLWGFFPRLTNVQLDDMRRKQILSGRDQAKRALIPYKLSLAVALSVEYQLSFKRTPTTQI